MEGDWRLGGKSLGFGDMGLVIDGLLCWVVGRREEVVVVNRDSNLE